MKKLLLLLFIAATFLSHRSVAQGCGGPASDEALKVFGFVQAQYENHFTDPGTNTFSFERTRIGVMGSIPYDFPTMPW
jgi:phosphate-selective porin OprO and OprP